MQEKPHTIALQNTGTFCPLSSLACCRAQVLDLSHTTKPRAVRSASVPQLLVSFHRNKPPGPTRKRVGVQRTREEKQRINSAVVFWHSSSWENHHKSLQQNRTPLQEQGCPEHPETCRRAPEIFPEHFPAAEEAEKARRRERASQPPLLREGG